MESKENYYPLFGGTCRMRRACSCAESGDGVDRDNTDMGACTSGHDPLDGASLAMVYSPEQAFDGLYEPEEGLTRGTVFIALEKPFFGDGRKC